MKNSNVKKQALKLWAFGLSAVVALSSASVGYAQVAQQGSYHQNVLQYGNAYSTPVKTTVTATPTSTQPQTALVIQQSTIQHPPNEPAQIILKNLLEANQIPSSMVESLIMDEEDVLNASTDGRAIYFTNKLWNTLENNDQRAFVIAHELSHVTHRHVPEAVGRRVGLSLFSRVFSGWLSTKTGPTATIANSAAKAGLVLADLKFSRGAEYEADESGIQYMVNAGYNAKGAIETLEILDKNSGDGTPQFLRSHPLNPNRIEAISNKYSSQFASSQ